MATRPLPHPCVIVLVGAPASGKSTWAAENVRADQIVSSDALRSVVGAHELDLAASDDAFDLVEQILDKRSSRALTTVVDTTGLDATRRERYLAIARAHNLTTVAVRFSTSATECKRRNRQRAHPVPVRIVDSMSKTAKALDLEQEDWDLVLEPEPIRVVTPKLAPSKLAPSSDVAAARQAPAEASEDRSPMRFGLHLSDFTWAGEADQIGPALRDVAQRAEAAGFDSLWVMDHLIQIPQLGSAWDPMLESYTTLAHLAAATERIRLGVLVSPATTRNVGVLAKAIATLDVLSGGRAIAGLGAGNFEREHHAFGLPFPEAPERLARLEEMLQALPLVWGAGTPSFEGRYVHVPEALAYPRPLQDPMPIIVGGSGEHVTLRLAAQYASGCNLFGDAATVRRKVEALHAHCGRLGRDPADIEVTHLSTVLIGRDRPDLDTRIDRHRSSREGPDAFAARNNAGTIDDHLSRIESFRQAGVGHLIMTTPDLADSSALDHFGDVFERWRALEGEDAQFAPTFR